MDEAWGLVIIDLVLTRFIHALKLTDLGLADVENFQLINTNDIFRI